MQNQSRPHFTGRWTVVVVSQMAMRAGFVALASLAVRTAEAGKLSNGAPHAAVTSCVVAAHAPLDWPLVDALADDAPSLSETGPAPPAPA